MANKKISELDLGTTPLTGDELVAVVQGGVTVRVPSSALKGLQGDDGREVELQKGTTHIQWRYVGDPTWTDLVALADITGPPGSGGPTSWDDITGKPSTFPPGGGAGGVLSGNYPNPGFAVDMATQGELDTLASATVSALAGKVDTVVGKGLSAEDYTSAEKTKLSGVATGATANSTDATLLARANHTGSQAIDTVTGLQTALDAKLPSDFSTLTEDTSIDGTETVALSGGLKATLSAIFTWFKTQANSWTARQTFKDVVETVFAVTDGASVDINPANGSIQTWTLGANRTPTATNFVAGQAVTLMVDDGTAYTITWSTIGVTWLTADGNAPTLKTTGYTAIVLWKVGATVYGK